MKLLSELHHPFIVGYRESFLEGEVLNIVMNYCLTEEHQVLTNRGFMFLEQIEPYMHSFEKREAQVPELLFATYNPREGCMEYLPATSLIVNAPGAQMIDITSSSIASPCSADSSEKYGNGVSVCVTADHDMYVLSSEKQQYKKQKASSLLSKDPAAQVQLLAHAKQGFSPKGGASLSSDLLALLPHFTLDASIPQHLDAFLSLYGYWLLRGNSLTAENDEQRRFLDSHFAVCPIHSFLPQQHLLSTAFLPEWTWTLRPVQLQMLLEGMRLASSASPFSPQYTILASSSQLRDDIVRVCLHAGFTAHFTTISPSSWCISYSLLPSLTHPTVHPATDIRSLPQEQYKGRTWCITVPPHGLIWTRRVTERDALTGAGLCASRPVVIGNCEGGDLTTLIKQQDSKYFSEDQILDWFIQLCLSLRYIHDRKIIHRSVHTQRRSASRPCSECMNVVVISDDFPYLLCSFSLPPVILSPAMCF